jgi:magnesium-transporting ATPase (P-type)
MIMNKLVSVIFGAHVIVSLISLICYIMWTTMNYDVLGYLCFQTSNDPRIDPIFENCKETNEYSYLGYFFTFYILFNNFVPISLYVTCETVNYIQAYFIDNDIKMFDSVSNVPTIARTSNMNGDLGMIEYIFSDKTGTLTQNIMIFSQCSVGGKIYCMDPCDSGNEGSDTGCVHESLDKLYQLSGQSSSEDLLDEGNAIAHFVFVLSVAHTVAIDPLAHVRLLHSVGVQRMCFRKMWLLIFVWLL